MLHTLPTPAHTPLPCSTAPPPAFYAWPGVRPPAPSGAKRKLSAVDTHTAATPQHAAMDTAAKARAAHTRYASPSNALSPVSTHVAALAAARRRSVARQLAGALGAAPAGAAGAAAPRRSKLSHPTPHTPSAPLAPPAGAASPPPARPAPPAASGGAARLRPTAAPAAVPSPAPALKPANVLSPSSRHHVNAARQRRGVGGSRKAAQQRGAGVIVQPRPRKQAPRPATAQEGALSPVRPQRGRFAALRSPRMMR